MELMLGIYFVLVVIFCMIGAVIGLGGGTLLRPTLDAIGFHNIYNISFLISFAVVVMSVFATKSKLKGGANIDFMTALFLSVGSLIGGLAGNQVFRLLLNVFNTDTQVQLMQAVFTTIILVLAIYFSESERFRYKLTNRAVYPVLGAILGFTAVILGLGGGVLVMPVLKVLFSMDTKQAAVLSIIVVFFSHLVNMITMLINMGFSAFDVSFMPVIVIGAAIGGLGGAAFSKRVSSRAVARLFNITMVCLIGLNIYNIIMFANNGI